VRLSGECVLRVEQRFNATEQGFHAIAFLHDCRYAEKLGEPFAKKVVKQREDHDRRFGMLMLSCAATSIPFAIGRLRSKTTRSGLRVCAFLIASSPSAASQISNRERLSMKLRMAFLTEASSSQ